MSSAREGRRREPAATVVCGHCGQSTDRLDTQVLVRYYEQAWRAALE